MKKSVFSRLSFPVVVGFLLSLMPVLTSSILTAWVVSRQSEIEQWSFIQWIVVTALLAVTSAIALTPPTFLALVYGFFLGWSSLPLLLGLNIGAIGLVFLVAQFFHAEAIRENLIRAYPKTEALLRQFDSGQLNVIFFTKLSPVLPFAVTNLLFAIAGARFRNIILGGAAGMIPRTILAVWVGCEARDIVYLLDHPNENLANKLLLLGLIIASVAGIGRFFTKKGSIRM